MLLSIKQLNCDGKCSLNAMLWGFCIAGTTIYLGIDKKHNHGSFSLHIRQEAVLIKRAMAVYSGFILAIVIEAGEKCDSSYY